MRGEVCAGEGCCEFFFSFFLVGGEGPGGGPGVGGGRVRGGGVEEGKDVVG